MYDGVQCTVVVYVDDLMITCANREPIDAVIALFRKRFHDLTVNEGVVHSYLGMLFDFSSASAVKISDRYTNICT